MKKEDARQVMDEFKKMGQDNVVDKRTIEEDRKRLRRILRGRMV